MATAGPQQQIAQGAHAGGSGGREPAPGSPVDHVEKLISTQPLLTAIAPLVRLLLFGPLRFRRFTDLAARWDREDEPGRSFETLTSIMGFTPTCDGPGVPALTGPGPFIIVGNHPFSAIELVAIGHFIEQAHPDFKVMASEFSGWIKPLQRFSINVDSFGRYAPKTSNMAPLKQCMATLKRGSPLVIFPSGDISHWHFSTMSVTDPKWADHFIHLARRCDAPILPVFFHGRNSVPYYLVGVLSRQFRIMAFLRQFFRKVDSGGIHMTVGTPFRIDELNDPDDVAGAVAQARARVYALQGRKTA